MQPFDTYFDSINLSDAADLATERTGKKHSEADILRMGTPKKEIRQQLKIFAASEDFVMTVPYQPDPAFWLDVPEKAERFSDDEINLAYRSFARGELYQLHPRFVGRLVVVGSMTLADFPIHALTHAVSKKALPGWLHHAQDEEAAAEYWTRTFDSSITESEEAFCIGFANIRIARDELIEFFDKADEQPTTGGKHSGILNLPCMSKVSEDLPNWKAKVQAEAASRWRRQISYGATPTKNSLKDELSKWCRENKVFTNYGVPPRGEYIARHVLKDWKPPID